MNHRLNNAALIDCNTINPKKINEKNNKNASKQQAKENQVPCIHVIFYLHRVQYNIFFLFVFSCLKLKIKHCIKYVFYLQSTQSYEFVLCYRNAFPFTIIFLYFIFALLFSRYIHRHMYTIHNTRINIYSFVCQRYQLSRSE